MVEKRKRGRPARPGGRMRTRAFRVDEAVWNAWLAKAVERRLSVSQLMREAVSRYVRVG